MINHSSIYHISVISAYYYGGCTFTGVAQAWLELTLGEHLSAKSLKSLSAWILTTGEAAVGLEANRGTSHDSCERKQKQHNLISSPGCPIRLSLQTQGVSSPMICEGKKVGSRGCGRKAWTQLPWGMCCSGSDVILLVQPHKSIPWMAVLRVSIWPYIPPCEQCKHSWCLLFLGYPRKFVPQLLQKNNSEGIKQTES